MENGTPKTFLTAEEAATYLGIAKITLYTYTSKRIIPYYKSRRKIYIKISDLDEFILNEANWIMPQARLKVKRNYMIEQNLRKNVKRETLNEKFPKDQRYHPRTCLFFC